ncbi:segregation/condensation protein A [Mycoplasmopsis hyopharyngis]|uniref:segregation/condensation protein A n=1 Tax=Mycoplasmopsis hyopharyngis TaxID=29558 RepID=UPI00387336C6
MKNIYETDDKRFDIKLENFDGPLDLLLSLVQDKNINIMDIDLADLATKYLAIIQSIQEQDIDIAGDYLVMAATLLQLKTRMLLYTPEEKPEIEEDKRAILARLAEYQQFKEIAGVLKNNELDRKNIFIKSPSNVEEFLVENDPTKLDGNSNPITLIKVLRQMFERTYANHLRQSKLETFTLTPKDQIPFIRSLFKNKKEVTFEEIFTVPSLNHFVITLIAVLELSKKQEIIINQKEQYGIITFTKGPEYEK